MRDKNRNIAFILIGVGLFMLFGKWISFFTIAALILFFIGLDQVRTRGNSRKGYMLFVIGGILLLLDHFTLLLGIILISLGLFYAKSKKVQRDDRYIQKQNLMSTLKWDREPWVLRNMSLWHVVGEVNLDLSLAIMEDRECVIVLQGALGDIDVTIPDDIGVQIEANVVFGQIDFNHEKEAGFMNKRVWQSLNYDESDQKVKLIISYIVGDIDIRIN
ncbi:hypothetical protein BVG16_04170 [Paenibacillus selenitireducens]|jgi:lia operon protein LiaF|uniref:Cell wall-active antibiotics response LiaF-like C-terminal domain-containing protein n=1 Tax=Paenibacillus selenitireducens TaxID=1324314 RepID=A0A1T2XJR6_9BACL|nr:cell wall-active antibiotics response protein LiaF [Paenibacillus selenitireducens]OPA79956.1 hypothetical protein BVG16_04170 [Paenibacillus selenitireducens]